MMIYKPRFAVYFYALGLCVLAYLGLSCEQKKPTEIQKTDAKISHVQRRMSDVKAAKLNLVFERLHQKGLFNGNILVVERGREIYKACWGYADFHQKKPLNAQTAFRIASISKQFTAMGILLLSEQGKLRLDEAVYTYLSDFPYKEITIRHLLAHTSGLPDYANYFAKDSIYTYARNSDIMNWLCNEVPPLLFEAGAQFQYNNTGYVVLAELISKLAEMPFALFLKKYVFEPLDMQHTFLLDYLQSPPTDNRAIGFEETHSYIIEDNPLNYIQGDGGMFSTIEDLQKWDKALYTQSLVQFSTLFQAYKPYVLPNGEYSYYGLGVYIKNDLRGVYHYGNWAGFQSVMIRSLYDRHCLIILTNDNNPRLEKIATMVENILYNKPFDMPQ